MMDDAEYGLATSYMDSVGKSHDTRAMKARKARKKRNTVKGSLRKELMKGKDKVEALPKLPDKMQGPVSELEVKSYFNKKK